MLREQEPFMAASCQDPSCIRIFRRGICLTCQQTRNVWLSFPFRLTADEARVEPICRQSTPTCHDSSPTRALDSFPLAAKVYTSYQHPRERRRHTCHYPKRAFGFPSPHYRRSIKGNANLSTICGPHFSAYFRAAKLYIDCVFTSPLT